MRINEKLNKRAQDEARAAAQVKADAFKVKLEKRRKNWNLALKLLLFTIAVFLATFAANLLSN